MQTLSPGNLSGNVPDRAQPPNLPAVSVWDCVPLRTFLRVVIALWLLTLLVGLAEHFIYHLARYHWSPFFPAYTSPDDFMLYKDRFRYFHQQSFFVSWQSEPLTIARFPFTYPAPAAVLFHWFFLFGRFSEGVLFGSFLVGAIAGALLFMQALVRRGLYGISTLAVVLVAGVLSYPILFALDRGNIELINVLLVWASIACIWRCWWYPGAVLLGLAVSLKIFPFLLVGIFVAHRKYGASLTVLLVAAISTLCSYWRLGPTFQAARAGTASGLEFFQRAYILSFDLGEAGFDHSLFTPVKLLQKAAHHIMPSMVGTSLAPWLRFYLLLGILCGLVLFFYRIIRLPLVNQIVALVSISILLPPLSADYTLVHLYAPFACLALLAVSATRSRKAVPGLGFAMLLLAVLVAPEGFLFLHGLRLSGLIKTSALLLLVGTAVTLPWEDRGLVELAGTQQTA